MPVALDVSAIRRATQDVSTCQKLIELLQNNSWNSLNTNNLHPEINTPKISGCEQAKLRANELLKQELSLTPEADLIIRGNRLVIPTKLRQQVISLAHEGHQGLIKTKKLLREKVWFPKIDTLTEKAVKECLACQSVGQPSKPAPIQPMPIPQQAWDVIYVDFLGPLPTKDLLLVIIDGRTGYPEVKIVRNTSANQPFNVLKVFFPAMAYHERLYQTMVHRSRETKFANICLQMGSNTAKLRPIWPQANGEDETFMKPLTKCLQTAVVEHKDWKLKLK